MTRLAMMREVEGGSEVPVAMRRRQGEDEGEEGVVRWK